VPLGDLPPTLIDRPTAATVGFSFFAIIGPGTLTPGTTSALLVVQTNAPSFTPTFASVIDGTVATVASYAPSPVIPEPSTLGLATVVIAGMGAYPRRRKSRG
jgi:hypothetical protein